MRETMMTDKPQRYYADYLADKDRVEQPLTNPVYERPRDGHGTVFVMRHSDGAWNASWQDEQRVVDCDSEDEVEVMAWARVVPAAERKIYDHGLEDYVNLP
jgi:hypothetical protein